jgi:hypothetical protein
LSAHGISLHVSARRLARGVPPVAPRLAQLGISLGIRHQVSPYGVSFSEFCSHIVDNEREFDLHCSSVSRRMVAHFSDAIESRSLGQGDVLIPDLHPSSLSLSHHIYRSFGIERVQGNHGQRENTEEDHYPISLNNYIKAAMLIAGAVIAGFVAFWFINSAGLVEDINIVNAGRLLVGVALVLLALIAGHAALRLMAKSSGTSICGVPFNAEIKASPGCGGKLIGRVVQAEISEALLLESISVFNPPVHIDGAHARDNVGYFGRSQRTVEPYNFAKLSTSRKRKGELWVHGGSGEHSLILYGEDINSHPAHHGIGWTLPGIFNEHKDTGHVIPVRLRRLNRGAVIKSGAFRHYIGAQLSFAAFLQMIESSESDNDSNYSSYKKAELYQGVGRKQTREIALRGGLRTVLFILGCLLSLYSACWGASGWRRHDHGAVALWTLRILSAVLIGTGLGAFFLPVYYDCRYNKECDASKPSHSGQIVPRKYLTSNSYWGTSIDMANALNTDKQIAVISALTEGSSIRSIERMTGVHRDTIMRLGVKVGQGCAKLMDNSMRELPCNRLEMDEIWGFVGKKDRNVREGDEGVGSVWTFCAIDAETKLVPAFKVGHRDAATAKEFVQDVASRMAYRVPTSYTAQRPCTAKACQ